MAKNEAGYSLVEIIIIVLWVGIFAAIAVPRLNFAIISKHKAEATAKKIVTDLRRTRRMAISNLKESLERRKKGLQRVISQYAFDTTLSVEDVPEALDPEDLPLEDSKGKVLDFHALRHTFITNLRNVSSRVAQSLARHQSSAMTDRYTHVRLHDERDALNSLPDLTLPSTARQKAVATGTDGKNLAENLPCKDEQTRTGTKSSGRDIPNTDRENRFSKHNRSSVSDYKSTILKINRANSVTNNIVQKGKISNGAC